jgi:hypothetical protein
MERPDLDKWLLEADAVLAEIEPQIAELKRRIEEVEEGQLVLGWFALYQGECPHVA